MSHSCNLLFSGSEAYQCAFTSDLKRLLIISIDGVYHRYRLRISKQQDPLHEHSVNFLSTTWINFNLMTHIIWVIIYMTHLSISFWDYSFCLKLSKTDFFMENWSKSRLDSASVSHPFFSSLAFYLFYYVFTFKQIHM